MPATKEHVRAYRQKLRQRALEAVGRRCVFCGTKQDVQCAHVRETGLSGRNERGMDRRYRDVLKHPDAYRPMCAACHRTFDRLVKLARPAVEKDEPIPF